jgi:ABC-type spermidine/putrescine transport system permease subunit II
VLLLAGGFTEGDAQRDLYAGGWHWQAAGTSLVEATLAATLPLFLIGWFQRHLTSQGPLLQGMSAAAYGAFIIHPPVIVGLALALHGTTIPAELKFVLVVTGGVVGSFGITSLLMRIPAVGKVVGSGPRTRPQARRAPVTAQPLAR